MTRVLRDATSPTKLVERRGCGGGADEMARRGFLESVMDDIARSIGRAAGRKLAETVVGTKKRPRSFRRSPPSARPPPPRPALAPAPTAVERRPAVSSSPEAVPTGATGNPSPTDIAVWIGIGVAVLGVAITVAIAGAVANASDGVQQPKSESPPELPTRGEFVARQRLACLGANTNSCALVIGALLVERPGPTELAEIERLADQVCDHSAIDCRIVADILGKSADARVRVLARRSYDRACRGNEARACVAIAGMLEGEGSEGIELAVKLYSRTCDYLDEGSACARLAELWRSGVAGRKSLARARHYRERACELGQRTFCAESRRTTHPRR